MPNPFEFQRLRNIFDPSIMGQGGTPIPGMGPTPDLSQPMVTTPPFNPNQGFDVTQRMGELYQPETGAQDAFEALQAGYPQYEKPGIWRSIAGALTAFGPGGHELGMQVANQNNDRRLREWKDKIGPAQQAANMERQENINRRQLAHNTVQNELSYRRDDARAKTQEETNRIRQQRADVYEWKTRNPQAKIVVQRGGNILAINPVNGATIRDFGSAGTMSEQEKMDLEQQYALDRIGATGQQNRQTEEVRQTGRTDIAETRGWKVYNVPDPLRPGQSKAVKINEITGETQDLNVGPVQNPASGAGAGGILPTQQRIQNFNKALEIWNTRPDLRPYMRRDGNDFFINEGKSWGETGKAHDAQMINELRGLLYPQDSGPMGRSGSQTGEQPKIGGGRGGGSGRGNQPRFTPQNPPPAPPGYKYIPKPGGGWTAVATGGSV